MGKVLVEEMMKMLDERPGAGTKILANYVAGRWIAESDLLPVTNPATGEIIARASLSGRGTVDQAVQAAHAAFESWRNVPVQERARYMFALRDLNGLIDS